MATFLTVPDYPDPQGAPGATMTAYLAITALSPDFLAGRGTLTAHVYRTPQALAAGAEPVDRIAVATGGRPVKFAPGDRLTRRDGQPAAGPAMPALAQVQAATQAHWDALAGYLLAQLAALDAFTGGTVTTA